MKRQRSAVCAGCGKHFAIQPHTTTRVVWADSYPGPLTEYCHNACLAQVIALGTRNPAPIADLAERDAV